jgi:hypothetical protein
MALVDVLEDPSSESPKMAFNNGQVSNGAAVLDSSLPNIPGSQSTWTVTEWAKTAYLQPTSMIANDAALADPLYGDPLYTWEASDGLTQLSVYSENGATTGGSPYVYDLEETDGEQNGDGADLFLTSNPVSAVPMDNPLIYSLDMKVNVAEATKISATQTNGLAQVFTGFSLVFNAPGTPNYDPSLSTISALMQISAASSLGTGAAGTGNEYLSVSGNSITFQDNLPGDQSLPFQASAGAPTELTYNVNNYLDAMIADDPSLPAQATNLGNWVFEGLYIGEEVDYATAPISVGIQVSNLQLQTDPTQTVAYQPPTAASSSAPPPPQPLFSMMDSSQNNTTTTITADSYDGPLSFLAHADAFSYNGSDNVAISAEDATNPLIASGSGDDALVGAASGHSVLDAGTGINIDVDGGSHDNTFVQNDYISGNTWDFLKGWGGSDEDIFFGFIPGLSKISVTNSGLGPYTGATVTIQPGNGNTDAATFVGVSAGSLHGTYADIDGVPSWIVWT